jgi:hypothetical protein
MTTENNTNVSDVDAVSQLGYDLAREAELERQAHDLVVEGRRARLELLRTAKEVLIENKRNLPVTERVLTDQEIITFATSLEDYIKTI